MRSAIIFALATVYGIASTTPVEIPVVSVEERDSGVIDASACFVTAFSRINCAGPVGDNEGVPTGNNKGVCIGTGKTAGPVRHSYSISNACPILSVFLYKSNGCAGNQPQEVAQGPGCFNIVSDGTVNSIRFVQPQ